jgi:hypothetical protein
MPAACACASALVEACSPSQFCLVAAPKGASLICACSGRSDATTAPPPPLISGRYAYLRAAKTHAYTSHTRLQKHTTVHITNIRAHYTGSRLRGASWRPQWRGDGICKLELGAPALSFAARAALVPSLSAHNAALPVCWRRRWNHKTWDEAATVDPTTRQWHRTRSPSQVIALPRVLEQLSPGAGCSPDTHGKPQHRHT